MKRDGCQRGDSTARPRRCRCDATMKRQRLRRALSTFSWTDANRDAWMFRARRCSARARCVATGYSGHATRVNGQRVALACRWFRRSVSFPSAGGEATSCRPRRVGVNGQDVAPRMSIVQRDRTATRRWMSNDRACATPSWIFWRDDVGCQRTECGNRTLGCSAETERSLLLTVCRKPACGRTVSVLLGSMRPCERAEVVCERVDVKVQRVLIGCRGYC